MKIPTLAYNCARLVCAVYIAGRTSRGVFLTNMGFFSPREVAQRLFEAAEKGTPELWRKLIPKINELLLSGCEQAIGKEHLVSVLGSIARAASTAYHANSRQTIIARLLVSNIAVQENMIKVPTLSPRMLLFIILQVSLTFRLCS